VKDFFKGVAVGVGVTVFLFGVGLFLKHLNDRDKKLFETMEVQIEAQKIIGDVSGRDPQQFVDELPGVRGAADSGVEYFNRKRDEAVERIRSGRTD
jgi:hypothetical protein